MATSSFNGERVSSYTAYVKTLLDSGNKNLTVIRYANVDKVKKFREILEISKTCIFPGFNQ